MAQQPAKKQLRTQIRARIRALSESEATRQSALLQERFLQSDVYANTKAFGIYLPMRGSSTEGKSSTAREAGTLRIIATALYRDGKRVFVPTVATMGPPPRMGFSELRAEVGGGDDGEHKEAITAIKQEQGKRRPDEQDDEAGHEARCARFQQEILSRLPVSKFGIPEPPLDLATEAGRAANAEAIRAMDTILVPGVGFSKETCDRIGQGAGFYDRWIAESYGAVDDKAASARPTLVGYGFNEQFLHEFPRDVCAEWDQKMDALLSPDGWAA